MYTFALALSFWFIFSDGFVAINSKLSLKSSSLFLSSVEDYPQQFTGRLWFSPSLVKIDPSNQIVRDQLESNQVSVLSFLGYTLGGVVALEYDTSPVGKYKEYVTMSALVYKSGAFGQWGSRLYVSERKAEEICQSLWGIPAEFANIEFDHFDEPKAGGNERLKVVVAPPKDEIVTVTMETMETKKSSNDFLSQIFGNNGLLKVANQIPSIQLKGWKNTRVLKKSDDENLRWGQIPVYWTPTIKALWTPPLLSSNKKSSLPLYKLRLSASALRLHWSGWNSPEGLGIPIGLVVDNVLIEIGTRRQRDL